MHSERRASSVSCAWISLGEEYSEEALNAIFKRSRSHKPKRNYHSLPRQNERLALLTNIQAKMQGRGPGYERWSKTYYLKQMAKTVLYMSEHDLDFETLKQESSEKARQNNELLTRINAIDDRLKEISDLKYTCPYRLPLQGEYRVQCVPKESNALFPVYLASAIPQAYKLLLCLPSTGGA